MDCLYLSAEVDPMFRLIPDSFIMWSVSSVAKYNPAVRMTESLSKCGP